MSKPIGPAFLLFFAMIVLAPLAATAEDPVLGPAFDRLPAAEKHFQAGLKEFTAGRYEAAAAAFDKCLAEVPRHAYAGYYLANIAYIRGDLQTALSRQEKALADLPFMADLNAYAVGRKSRSIASYQQALDTQWENTTSCRESRELEALNDELITRKSKIELATEKERAARTKQEAHYRYFLGNILFQLQRPADAARLYGEAIALDPRHVNAYNNAAAIRYMAGDQAGALDLLERAEREGLGDNINLKLKHLVFETLGRPTAGILEEDLAAGPEADLGARRFALAYKFSQPLLPPLYVNAYVVFSRSTKQAVLVDAGVDDPRIGAFVAANGLTVKAILDTHSHPDHTAANARYAALFGAPVVAPAPDAKDVTPPPDRTVGDGETLRYEGFAVQVILTPGHTPGSASFLAGGYLFTGDTLFKNDICRLPEETPGKAAETRRRFVRMIGEKLLTLDDAVRVCPGHGAVSTIGEEKKANPFFAK
jgi:glyoxylase-like metal-dependent hydrolase (beta-lactamase superfamily II)/Tfp pilus assembly protein PilF